MKKSVSGSGSSVSGSARLFLSLFLCFGIADVALADVTAVSQSAPPPGLFAANTSQAVTSGLPDDEKALMATPANADASTGAGTGMATVVSPSTIPANAATAPTTAAASSPVVMPSVNASPFSDNATSASSAPALAPTDTVNPMDSSASPPENDFGSTPNSRAAFTNVVRNLMPLSPQQIVTLRDMFDRSQQAANVYPGVPPKPTSSSILVNMSPGSTPPVIRLRAGYVTSLVFLDSTGQPWPVTGYDLGNPRAFNIAPSAPDGKSDTLIVQASHRYQEGNLAVMLKDENTPVMLTLIPGQRAVDYRVDLRVPGLGPNAVVGVAGLPQTENPMLLNFMDGVAPEGARLLKVVGAPAQAWSYNNRLFLRTRVTLLSPGWMSSMSSPDGTHVYELMKTPVVLTSQRGQMIQLSIKGL